MRSSTVSAYNLDSSLTFSCDCVGDTSILAGLLRQLLLEALNNYLFKLLLLPLFAIYFFFWVLGAFELLLWLNSSISFSYGKLLSLGDAFLPLIECGHCFYLDYWVIIGLYLSPSKLDLTLWCDIFFGADIKWGFASDPVLKWLVFLCGVSLLLLLFSSFSCWICACFYYDFNLLMIFSYTL